ncbi:MAG TPA: tail-specific protease, partial [Planctomycetaceae bacterium]|nr:tail-specific protease [Planctomycetaceae bacterium]
ADVVLPSLTTHMDIGEADLEYAIDFDRIQPAEFQRYAMVTRDIVRKLIERSQSRRQKSEDFIKLNRRIAEYLEQKAKKKIALNREEYIAAHKEFNARKAEEDQFEKQINPDETIRRDYYLNEVFQIGVDYLRELEKLHLARRR